MTNRCKVYDFEAGCSKPVWTDVNVSAIKLMYGVCIFDEGTYTCNNGGYMDWTNKEQVIAYAKKLGKGQTVFKHPSRNNYNITHTVRTDRYKSEWVVYQS